MDHLVIMLPMQTMHQHYHPSSSSIKNKEPPPAPAPLPALVKNDDGRPVAVAPLPAFFKNDDGGLVVKVGDRRQAWDGRPVAAGGRREAAAAIAESAAVDVCLAAAAMAGAALLAWWAVVYHPSYAQLWMVPLGLVLAGTPPVVCIALRFSSDDDNSRAPQPGKGSSGSAGASPPLVAVVVHK